MTQYITLAMIYHKYQSVNVFDCIITLLVSYHTMGLILHLCIPIVTAESNIVEGVMTLNYVVGITAAISVLALVTVMIGSCVTMMMNR